MSDPAALTQNPPDSAARLAARLGSRVTGEVRFDALSRALYATDASIYEITPLGVVFPKCVDDVSAVIEECRSHGTSVVPRGAGTGLTGGAVGPGVQLDLSRHMNRIGRLDASRRTIDVEPGVVLDELNAHLAAHGLQFAPDVATGSRATIGGMIANNSCGSHSVVYGRTVDHVAALTVVSADGRPVTFGDPVIRSGGSEPAADAERQRIETELGRIRDAHFDEIERRFPKVMRSNGGYGLDRLGPAGSAVDAVKVLCGSEGTLGVIVAATLRLVPLPLHTAVVVLPFHDLLDALEATPAILRHQPAAIELVDRLIISAGLSNPAIARRCGFLDGEPAALLAVEFFGQTRDEIQTRVRRLTSEAASYRSCETAVPLLEPEGQSNVWNLRKAGLGLLMSRPGDAQPYAFVEDSAVDPSRLREYIGRFASLLDAEGVHAGYYAHASVGCIHVKPVLNLNRAEDVERMHRIADRVSSLALSFGGAMTGEHGDGIVRSCWLEKMYGPQIVGAFREVKRVFDPHNTMNPHKIVDPWPMTERLRYGPKVRPSPVKTHLDFGAFGGMAGLARMCTGVGQCRQRLVGTMCPSYMATGDETHTTRARANALRIALSNRGLLDGLADPSLDEVMDLCIGCKACKSECPTGVDMARLKAEHLSDRNLRRGVSRRARLIAQLPCHLATASRWPRLVNRIAGSRLARRLVERRYGLDRRIAPPRLSHQTFRSWFRRHARQRKCAEAPRGPVVYLVDTWTNYFTPQVGAAAVELLEHAGFEVYCPSFPCCGRSAISQGMLLDARQTAEANVRTLAPLAARDWPIVGTEPSCTLTLVDEYPQLVRTESARRVARQTMMIETLLLRTVDADRDAMRFGTPAGPLAFHAHCHQKALVGTADASALLKRAWGEQATEINSGCCGMAGSFGHEVEHYEIARVIGEQRLFPAIRGRGPADVAVSGFSCRTQIEHHTGVTARHLVEYLRDALAVESA